MIAFKIAYLNWSIWVNHHMARYLAFLYGLSAIIAIVTGKWLIGVFFIINVPLWYFLLEQDRRSDFLRRYLLIPVALDGLVAINPLLPAAPNSTASSIDGMWELLLLGSLVLFTLFGLILRSTFRRV